MYNKHQDAKNVPKFNDHHGCGWHLGHAKHQSHHRYHYHHRQRQHTCTYTFHTGSSIHSSMTAFRLLLWTPAPASRVFLFVHKKFGQDCLILDLLHLDIDDLSAAKKAFKCAMTLYNTTTRNRATTRYESRVMTGHWGKIIRHTFRNITHSR